MSRVSLLEKQGMTFTHNPDFGVYMFETTPALFSLTIGESYVVDFAGTEHTSIAFNASGFAPGTVGIGNPGYLGGESNDMPFIVMYVPSTDFTGIATALGEGPYEIAVYQVVDDAKIFLKDNNGVNQEYSATKIRLNKSDGTKAIFSEGEAVENVPITLDFSDDAQTQTVTAPTGQLVKSAVIQKPTDLIPENIAEGIDIAGVVGSLVAGGGGNVVMAGGTFTGNGGRVSIAHNLGVIPDLFVAFLSSTNGSVTGMTRYYTSPCFVGLSTALREKLGVTYAQFAPKVSSSTGMDIERHTYGMETSSVSRVLDTATTTMAYPGSSYAQTMSGKQYTWFAIGGLT